ncbi:MAG: ATP-binding protein [Vampirovibrionia bacterium]
MFRRLDEGLKKWKKDKHPKPLMLRGARQVGKSFLVEKFAKENFQNLIKINFEKERNFSHHFDGDLDLKRILETIAIIKKQKLNIGTTLIFFDEIQECPRAIVALRYIYEDIPGLHCIAAGSLLEFALEKESISMPVGRIKYIYMYPMSFVEYLMAKNEDRLLKLIREMSLKKPIDDSLHQHLLKEFKIYMFIGGMPEAVNNYIQEDSLKNILDIQSSIIETYRDDFLKYSSRARSMHVEKIFNLAPQFIGQKFKYSQIDANLQSRELKAALDLLCKARVYRKVLKTSGEALPFAFHASEKHFKLLFMDVGLMHNMLNLSSELLTNESFYNLAKGALVEQVVGQELLAYHPYNQAAELYFWNRDGRNISAELDYLYAANDTDDENAEIIVQQRSSNGTAAERGSSRLRRTNNRSVRVISSDAEHVRQVSYVSKRKYKLDLSSLHEDYEDDENAEIIVRQQCQRVFGLEVKSGARGKMKSLYSFMKEYDYHYGLALSSENISFEKGILKVPIYAVSELDRLLKLLDKPLHDVKV